MIILSFHCDMFAAEATIAPPKRAPTFAVMEKECPGEDIECVIKYFTEETRTFCDHEIVKVDPSYWKESRQLQPLPDYQKAVCMPKEIVVSQIRFMQESSSGEFTDLKHDIFELAHDLQSGKTKVSDLPAIEVWQDRQGRIWTTNHRRLVALLLSGTAKKIPVTFVDEETVMKNRNEFTTTNEGKKIHVWLTDDAALIIGNDNRCAESN